MYIQDLFLKYFRSYKTATFQFDPMTTIIVGPNGSGKTNLLEAIILLATGKSKKAEKDEQLIRFSENSCQMKGKILSLDETVLEIRFSQMGGVVKKKYLVNDIPKRRLDFAGNLLLVHFSPFDLDITTGQPSIRRKFLDDVLEQTDFAYRNGLSLYMKALKQRNALLENVQKTGVRNERLFSYFDELVITNGTLITQKRNAFIEFLNEQERTLFPFYLHYDSSIVSQERLLKYKDAEIATGVTLVGPHRDDIQIVTQGISGEIDVRHFASRGQQRLVALEMKLLQLQYITKKVNEKPLLLLDDIFSELDEVHIEKILTILPSFQTIITTTHEELLPKNYAAQTMIELKK